MRLEALGNRQGTVKAPGYWMLIGTIVIIFAGALVAREQFEPTPLPLMPPLPLILSFSN
jgi:hypothetical protein